MLSAHATLMEGSNDVFSAGAGSGRKNLRDSTSASRFGLKTRTGLLHFLPRSIIYTFSPRATTPVLSRGVLVKPSLNPTRVSNLTKNVICSFPRDNWLSEVRNICIICNLANIRLYTSYTIYTVLHSISPIPYLSINLNSKFVSNAAAAAADHGCCQDCQMDFSYKLGETLRT
jgi:hypothetical protein